MEEEEKPATGGFVIGQDLSSLSVDELSETVNLLRLEIDRLEAAKAAKSDHMAVAESLFKGKS